MTDSPARWTPATTAGRWKTYTIQTGGRKAILLDADGETLATVVKLPGTLTRVYWADGIMDDTHSIDDLAAIERAAGLKTADDLNAKGLALTRAVTTATLAESFADTDRLLEQAGLTADQRADLTTARGWIIDVLEERGELAAIGMTADYERLAGRFAIKCDTCKTEIGRTDSLAESAAGDTCSACRGDTETLYELRLENGDTAEAENVGGILLAAHTLTTEASVHQGDRRRLRAGLVITRNGNYDGLVTTMARDGRTS